MCPRNHIPKGPKVRREGRTCRLTVSLLPRATAGHVGSGGPEVPY